MKLKKLFCIALTLSLFAAPSLSSRVYADDGEGTGNSLYTGFVNTGEKAYNEARYEDAERLINNALKEAKGPKGTNKMLVRCFTDLSTIAMNQGKYAKAEEYAKEAMQIIDNDPEIGAKSDKMAVVANNLAAIYTQLTRYDEAEVFYKQAISIAEENYGKNSPYVSLGWLNLGQLYYESGKFAQAREVLTHSLSTLQSPEAKATMYYAINLHHLGEVDRLEGNFKEAENYYKQAIAAGATSIGKNHPYYAGALQNYGELLTRIGRYKDAETQFNEALAICERQTNPNFPQKGKVWRELAYLYEEQGKYQQAEEMCNKALELSKKVYGTKHGEYASNLNCLATIYESEGKYAEAEPIFKECLTIRQQVFGHENPKVIRTLKNLGSLYTNEGKLTEAETTLNQALKLAEQKYKVDNAEITDIARELCETYEKQNKIDLAIPLSQRNLSSLEKNFGITSPRYAEGLRELASLTTKKKKYAEALALYKKALAIDEKELGMLSTVVAKDLSEMANVYTLMKDTANAQSTKEKAEKIKASLPGNKYSNEITEVTKNNQIVAERPYKPVGDKWAVVVGVSNFEDKSINLRYAAKDATDFANFLTSKGNFKADHVKLLVDENATKQNILDSLMKWLHTSTKREDLVVLYVSSHGSPAHEEETDNKNFLVAYDTNKDNLLATGIPLQWLSRIIQKSVQAQRVVLMLDVCHSGAARKEGAKTLFREPGIKLNDLNFGMGQAILCSSQADQVSWESKKYPNSVFTKRLIEGLVSQGPETPLTKAYGYLKDKVESEVMSDRGERQTPLLQTILWDGDDALIAAPLTKENNTVSTK